MTYSTFLLDYYYSPSQMTGIMFHKYFDRVSTNSRWSMNTLPRSNQIVTHIQKLYIQLQGMNGSYFDFSLTSKTCSFFEKFIANTDSKCRDLSVTFNNLISECEGKSIKPTSRVGRFLAPRRFFLFSPDTHSLSAVWEDGPYEFIYEIGQPESRIRTDSSKFII